MMRRRIGGRGFDFDREVAVMAVINRTPDSFYDKGATFALDRAVTAAVTAVGNGADWIDIGGVPFGRGPVVDLEEELARILPFVEAVAAESNVVISVDTNRAEVARQAIRAGASVINDTSGLWDERMAAVVAETDAHLVLTHSLAPPRSPHPRPQYGDVVNEVVDFLRLKIAEAAASGVPLDRLIVDPGHDLNKNTLHSLELTRRLGEIVEIGPPTLVAVSNKDFVGESLDRPQGQRLEGSLAAMVVCIQNGARIVRMHDIPETVAAVRMTETILGMREPSYLRHNVEDE